MNKSIGMKNYMLILVLSFMFLGQYILGQETSNRVLEQFAGEPREKVFVSINTSLLFTGEYLFYKVYCLNDKTKQLSDLSTIAYVELISAQKDIIFSHKVRLEKSQGEGDFFVPTTVPSGNYKLIAYTRWMKNGAMNLFFQEDVSILNPYQANQDAVLPDMTNSENIIEQEKVPLLEEDKRFVLTTDKESYPQKAKVTLGIQNYRGATGYGNYSISVRIKDGLKHPRKSSPLSYLEWHALQAGNAPSFYNEIKFAPEANGELLKGRISTNNGNLPLANQAVAISIPGKDFQIKVVGTDSTGLFYAHITKDYTEELAIFQVLDAAEGTYHIEIINDPPLDYTSLTFGSFYLEAPMEHAIIRRSLYNQIENGYYTVKPDTVKLDGLNDPYGGAYVESIDLDAYTRFKTLDETIIELVQNVWTKKNKDGTVSFKVRSFDETYEESTYDALVYIDGVLMPNHSDLLSFDSRLIKTVNTVREKYVLGGQINFGMINLVTKDANYFDKVNTRGMTKTNLERPRLPKRYFAQTHRAALDSSIPDFRYQLLWRPIVTLKGKQLDLSFYTSEVPGEYEVCLEGFSIYGRPVALKKSFTVE